MVLSNDERGWVMTCLSGVACALGASIICIDLLIRLLPNKRNFKIQDSDTFMSLSLSLSFGVMLFSSLYSMLPSAKRALIDGGNSPKKAAWILVACFIGGVVGIQFVSRILHHFMPSHVVDCEHNHDEEAPKESTHSHSHQHEPRSSHSRSGSLSRRSTLPGHLHRPNSFYAPPSRQSSQVGHVPQMYETSPTTCSIDSSSALGHSEQFLSRPDSMPRRVSKKLTQLAAGKADECSCGGQCYGFTDPCSPECFKKISDRGGYKASIRSKPSLHKMPTAQTLPAVNEATPLLQDVPQDRRPATVQAPQPATHYFTARENLLEGSLNTSSDTLESGCNEETTTLHKVNTAETESLDSPDRHHHHVPSNAFLSIGLQTSIAIALHKLPEGFITYATNHANPQLGVAVFLALFIHNITEGFAMALPLYLAIQSRAKAMVISFALGGLSQPLGAAVAAIWFHLAGDSHWAPDDSVYGAMFAVTAGIMASVALQLFSESLDLTHSKTLCMIGAFCGMGILGISSALTS